MKKRILNNWGLKLASLLFAFVLWLVVINVDDPVDDRNFANIKVTLQNTEVITDKNMVYEILDGTDVVRTVRVSAPKSVLDEMTAGDIVAEADCANLTVNDTIEIDFYSNRSKIQSITGSIEMVKLNIEDKKMKRLTLVSQTAGEPEDGYIVGEVKTDQNRIEISGPDSVVSRVNSAVVSVDVSDSTSDISTYADVILYDEDGAVVESDSLVMNTKSVRVGVQILATKEVPLEFSVMGEPAEGFMATGVVESDPATVTVAGSGNVLAGIGSIVIPEDALNITGQSANMLTIVDVRSYLPENVALTGGFRGKASVTVYIEKEETRELAIPSGRIRILGLSAGLQAELDNTVTEYRVSVKGLSAALAGINESTLYGNIQISGLLEEQGMEELTPGTYTVPVEFNFADGITVVEELKISMKIIGTEE